MMNLDQDVGKASEYLKKRLEILPRDYIGNSEIIHEVSFVTDQLFNLRYEKIKARSSLGQAHIDELNQLGSRCLSSTKQSLSYFPDARYLLRAVEESEVDVSTFEEYCKLLVRVADKSNRMVIAETEQRKKYLAQSASYYS